MRVNYYAAVRYGGAPMTYKTAKRVRRVESRRAVGVAILVAPPGKASKISDRVRAIMNRKLITLSLLFAAPMFVGVTHAESAVSADARHSIAAPAGSNGPAILYGQAYVTARGGELVTCAGGEVIVSPAVHDVTVNTATGGKLAPGLIRRTTCDSRGRFTFQGLPAGDWTVEASIRWVTSAKQGMRHLGGDLMQHVVLRPGDNKVALNDDDLLPPDVAQARMAQAVP